MRRWSLGGGLSARRSRPLARLHERPSQRVLEERSCGTDARGQRDRQRQRGLREAGAWGASEKRAFSELQLSGLRLARRKQEGGPALRAIMFMYSALIFNIFFRFYIQCQLIGEAHKWRSALCIWFADLGS